MTLILPIWYSCMIFRKLEAKGGYFPGKKFVETHDIPTDGSWAQSPVSWGERKSNSSVHSFLVWLLFLVTDWVVHSLISLAWDIDGRVVAFCFYSCSDRLRGIVSMMDHFSLPGDYSRRTGLESDPYALLMILKRSNLWNQILSFLNPQSNFYFLNWRRGPL